MRWPHNRDREPAAARNVQRVVAVAAALGCSVLSGCSAAQRPEPQLAGDCSHFDSDVERLWSAAGRGHVSALGTQAGAEVGVSQLSRVVTKLDAASADWVRLREQLCWDLEAKRVSSTAYAARSRCLDEALLRLRTLATVVGSGAVQDGEALLAASDRLAAGLAACGQGEATAVLAGPLPPEHDDPSEAAEAGRGLQLTSLAPGAPLTSAPSTSLQPGMPLGAAAFGDLYARSIAVVIGIDAYKRLPVLRAAEADARAVGAELSARGFEVRLLLGRNATRERVVGVLGDELPRTLSADDRVLVFFAGHGVSTGDGDSAMGYLMPWAGEREQPVSSGISMTELQGWLAGYAAKHVLFVADACYSGLALPHRGVALEGAGEQYMRMATRERTRFTLVAGQDNQEAWEMRGERRGAFTHFLLEALQGHADANQDGLITASEIYHYVTDRTFRYVWEQYRNEQRPTSAKSGRGEFVFFSSAPHADLERATAQ